jgi:ATP-dependent DNA ligase
MRFLDGEAVVLDEQGHPSFSALQSRLDGENRAEIALYGQSRDALTIKFGRR